MPDGNQEFQKVPTQVFSTNFKTLVIFLYFTFLDDYKTEKAEVKNFQVHRLLSMNFDAGALFDIWVLSTVHLMSISTKWIEGLEILDYGIGNYQLLQIYLFTL